MSSQALFTESLAGFALPVQFSIALQASGGSYLHAPRVQLAPFSTSVMNVDGDYSLLIVALLLRLLNLRGQRIISYCYLSSQHPSSDAAGLLTSREGKNKSCTNALPTVPAR